MSSRGQSQGIGLRRNGKEKACEPCRKGKLACDHSVPVCGRCVRRKIVGKCLYHPAPMTRNREAPIIPSPRSTFQHTSSNSTGRSSQILSPQERHEASNLFLGFENNPSGIGVPNQLPSPVNSGATDRIIINSPIFDWDKDAVFRRSARYYGPTSFSAVFNDGAKLSEDLNIGDDGRKHPANWPFGQPLLGRERPSAPSVRMDQIVKALWNMPSKEICHKLLGTFNSFHHYLMSPVMIRHCIETLWSNFGNELATPRTSEKLALIAEVMFRNEERPLPPAPEEGMDWLNGFMGQNLRFEMLGILFCFFGMSYQTLQDWDELFQVPENHGRDRKQTSWRMKECADICLKMNEISEENNEISIALMHTLSILESVCTGDESFQLRRRHGEIIVCTIAAGLHRLPDLDLNKVTAASEYKIRLFSVIYGSDKSHSSLNGTPPALSARFCTIRMPFDISEEDLYLPQVELAKVISRLDADGWDTSGEVHRATFHRALQVLSAIREEILDLALGIDVLLSEARIEDLHRRCQEAYDGLPHKVRYYAYDSTPKNTEGRVLVSQAYLMLNLLQNKFLIDRVAITRGFPKEQRLLNTALETMDLTNMFWIKRDQLMIYCSAFDWIFTCYGIPAAGVLCVELLKQATAQNVLQFSRSDAIQKLTMFIGFLEWIRPTDGNYLLAGRLKKVVRRILDRVLDPPPQMPTDNDMMPIDPMLAPFGEMDWLNTIDWTQGSSWMEFS